MAAVTDISGRRLPEPRGEKAAARAAIGAIQALIEARDDAVRALDALADAFARSEGQSTTFEEEARKPLGELIDCYYAETFALWSIVREHRNYIARDGDGSSFTFESLSEFIVPEIEGAFAAWSAKAGIDG